MTQPGEPERVRSGSFEIDRKRALELLARYGLKSPLLFPLPWVRAAVAAGATGVSAEDGRARFTLAFDGAPYSPAELEGLLSALPEEGAEPRLKELARGLATALPRAASVSIRSGLRAVRVVLRASAEGESVERCLEDEERTVVTLEWPGGRRPSEFDAAVDALRARAWPGVLALDGRHVGRLPGGFWQRFEQEGARGWLSPAVPRAPSTISAYRLGVACGSLSVELPGHAAVRAMADDAGLELDLQQESVVRGPSCDRFLERVGRAADGFALDACRRIGRILPDIGQWLRDPQAYQPWKEALAGAADLPAMEEALLDAQRFFALDAGTAERRHADLRRWAPVVAWLRDASLSLLGDGRRPDTDLERALWCTPLYMTVEGLPATLEELERLRVRFGRLTLSERPYSGVERLPPAVVVKDRRELLALVAGPVGDQVNP